MSPLFPFLQKYFGTKEIILQGQNIHRPRLQRQQDNENFLPFHQDGGFLGVMLLRAWVLITPETCGETAPSVAFLPGAHDTIQLIELHPISEMHSGLEMSHSVRDELLRTTPVWAPIISRGDILIFYGYTPHRTFFPCWITEKPAIP